MVFADFSNSKCKTFSGILIFINSALERIIYPQGFEVIPNRMFYSCQFRNFTFKKEFLVEQDYPLLINKHLDLLISENENIVIYNRVAYTSDYKTLILYSANGNTPILPYVEKISTWGGFSGCNFENFTLDLPIRVFPTWIFSDCDNLINLDISKSLITVLPKDFVSRCTKLQTLTLPDTLQSIRSYSFFSCTIQKLIIPPSIRSIANDGFKQVTILSIEYCGLIKFDTVITTTGVIKVNTNYAYSSCFGREDLLKTLDSCLPARTPLPTVFPSPICKLSCVNRVSSGFFSMSQLYVFILM